MIPRIGAIIDAELFVSVGSNPLGGGVDFFLPIHPRVSECVDLPDTFEEHISRSLTKGGSRPAQRIL